jgi:hypothetical protein
LAFPDDCCPGDEVYATGYGGEARNSIISSAERNAFFLQ